MHSANRWDDRAALSQRIRTGLVLVLVILTVCLLTIARAHDARPLAAGGFRTSEPLSGVRALNRSAWRPQDRAGSVIGTVQRDSGEPHDDAGDPGRI